MHNNQDTPGIPLSAVYRQLDSLPGPDGYDAAAAVTRMMTRWTAEGLTTPGPAARPPAAAADAEAGTFQQRADLVQHLARCRVNSTLTALATVLAIGGTAAAAAASHRAYPILAGIGAAAALLTAAVVLIHAITMQAILNDHTRLLGRPGSSPQQPATAAPATTELASDYEPGGYDDEDLSVDDNEDTSGGDGLLYAPAGRGLKRRAARTVLAALAVAATALAINAGTRTPAAAVIIAVAGTALLSAITGLVLVLGSTDRTYRAIKLLRALRDPAPARLGITSRPRRPLGPRLPHPAANRPDTTTTEEE